MNRHVVQREMNLLNRGRLNRAPTNTGNIFQDISKPTPNTHDERSSTNHLDGLNKLCNILVGLPEKDEPKTKKSIKFQDESEENELIEKIDEQPKGKFEPIPIISKAEKVSKTPTQLKNEAEKKKQKTEDAELIQKELNKKPQKPAEKLLNKLLKKQDRKKLPSHIKKAIKDIREFEKKRDTQEGTNNKILDAIKNAYA